MKFQNRKQAAELLVQALMPYRDQNPLVLGIPRGAVPMARIIADELNGEMNVILVHKLSAPYQPELAIGSIDEQGDVYLNEFSSLLNVSTEYLAKEKETQLQVLRHRRKQYTQAQATPQLRNRIVIIVDDGVATGATMIAALQSARKQQPARLIAATSVAPSDTLDALKHIADEVVCLDTPEDFNAVGQFFVEFPQVTDDEVTHLLKENNSDVKIITDSVELNGDLVLPIKAIGLVIFAHGSGSSRLSPRNQYVAEVLQQANIATLLFDLLTPEEDTDYQVRFDIALLTQRLISATLWVQTQTQIKDLPLAYFGASTGAAAALMAAAQIGPSIRSVVSRGGRPDLAMDTLNKVQSPTLLIVGGQDFEVMTLNQQAYAMLDVKKELAIVPHATHLFEETGTLEAAARLARDWFVKYF